MNLRRSGWPPFTTLARNDKGAGLLCPKRVAAMSDTQLTTIARLDERLTALKERL